MSHENGDPPPPVEDPKIPFGDPPPPGDTPPPPVAGTPAVARGSDRHRPPDAVRR